MFNLFKKKYKVSKDVVSFCKEEQSVRAFSKNDSQLALNLCSLAKAAFSKFPDDSIRVMKESQSLVPQYSKLKWLGFRLYDFGMLEESYNLLVKIPNSVFVASSEQSKFKKIIDEYEYIKYVNGFINNCDNNSSENKIFDEKFLDHKIQNDTILYKKNNNIRIAIVSDADFYRDLELVVDCVYVTPFNSNQIVSSQVDLLIITPTTLGIGECWDQLCIEENNEQRILLLDIIKTYNSLRIDTVFYSNTTVENDCLYDIFAKECKYIISSNKSSFTQNPNNLSTNVVRETLYFGINQLRYHPENLLIKNNYNVSYSGIWFPNNIHKCKTLNTLFSGVLLSSRQLFLANNIEGFSIGHQYKYPSDYQKYVLNLEEFNKKKNSFGWILNYSKSDNQYYSEQCIKALASGCLVISDYCNNLHENLPYVYIVRNSASIAEILSKNSLEDMYERRIFSIRFILRNFSVFHMFNKLLKILNFSNNKFIKDLSILVVGKINSFSEECFKWQSYKNKYFIDENSVNEEIIDKYDVVTWFSNDNLYEEFYLEDMINGFKYSNGYFVTKSSHIDGRKNLCHSEFCYVDEYTNIYQTVFFVEFCKKILKSILDNSNNAACYYPLHNGFCIDHLNFIPNYKNNALKPNKENKYKLSVIIPVFNNGDYLYAKSFSSLKCQKRFSEMEIVIVDDGSTDSISVQTIKYLARHYENVRTVFLEKGGSGSASYPRNKGIQVCSGEYITFLDSDDECILEGYSKILNIVDGIQPNIILGNNIFSSDVETLSDNYSLLKSVYGCEYLPANHKFSINDIDFKTIRIQSLVINRNYLNSRNLSFVNNAIGEDTLFSWQILHMSENILFTDICTHVYYSKRSDSVSNSFNYESLEKLSKLQPYKIKWLVDNNLIESYMEKKFENYTELLLFKYLKESFENQDQVKAKRQLLQKIIRCYKPYYLGNNVEIRQFIN